LPYSLSQKEKKISTFSKVRSSAK